MLHDMGLTEAYASPDQRFEVDGANAARDFLKSYGVAERDIEDVWTAIPLHTAPGVPEHMRPTIALVTAGVERDVLSIPYHDFTHEQRDHVCLKHPREANFKGNIIDHFARGIIKRPLTTFGNVKADVLALKDINHVRLKFLLDHPGFGVADLRTEALGIIRCNSHPATGRSAQRAICVNEAMPRGQWVSWH
jgi:hypothetical protein